MVGSIPLMATTITPELLRQMRADIDASMASIGEKYGVKLTCGNASFTATNATYKLAVSVISDGGEVVDKERVALERNLAFLGLSPEHMLKEFKIGSKTFVLHGLRSSARTKPLLIKSIDDGKTYVATTDAVRKAFGLSVAAEGV